MTARVASVMLAGALAVTACKGSSTRDAPVDADPAAGRARITVIYSGNMWAELLDCG